jgi:hypothetical protein
MLLGRECQNLPSLLYVLMEVRSIAANDSHQKLGATYKIPRFTSGEGQYDKAAFPSP